MSASQKRTLWIIAGALVLFALVRSHRVTTDTIIFFAVIVPSIILHEVSHGWVARACGDDTAARAGRLSLNPLVHVDPVGTLIVPALLALGSYGVFGWAKPVPVNVARLRSPRNQGVLVALAGPAMNAVLAALGAVLFIVLFRTSFNTAELHFGTPSLASRIVLYFGVANIGLMFFNLVPLPPLDGSVLFERALPSRHWPTYLRYRQYTMPLILGLVLLNFWLTPHGPLTWAYLHVYNWWLGLLGTDIRFG